MKIFDSATSVLLVFLTAYLVRASSPSTSADIEHGQDVLKRLNRAGLAFAALPTGLTGAHYLAGAVGGTVSTALSFSMVMHLMLDSHPPSRTNQPAVSSHHNRRSASDSAKSNAAQDSTSIEESPNIVNFGARTISRGAAITTVCIVVPAAIGLGPIISDTIDRYHYHHQLHRRDDTAQRFDYPLGYVDDFDTSTFMATAPASSETRQIFVNVRGSKDKVPAVKMVRAEASNTAQNHDTVLLPRAIDHEVATALILGSSALVIGGIVALSIKWYSHQRRGDGDV
ncbi:unnamed protein product [Tilletia laevis]|uniref:Uncharacterized protein n=2 Tax=Tilletia TaxID=13289 RepID=A0A177VBB5_9BASI|nr:hypothetical protein CF335_g4593 [Tilletia laevis]KAE8256795.1 hypothetical protein A4X03_0g5049 [Tilletia caries]CAD6926304.1 unnamed protein product [Tilletia caries]CAD6936099.1 unnamed protein product [Tilletia laevis]